MSTPDAEAISKLLRSSSGRKIYLIGAGGCGMSGLGHLLLDSGHEVYGSDLVWSEELRQLAARGARVQVGHDSQQLTAVNPELVVYSPAVRVDNPELKEARALGIPIVRRAFVLAALVNGHKGICVAGMHGKTTTTALLAFALERLHSTFGYAVGGLIPQMDRHARLPASRENWFVAETDESDGTLIEFQPELAVVLNVDEEHLDYYENLDAVLRHFDQFARQTRKQLFFCADDLRLAELYAWHPRAISFGFHALANYRIAHLQADANGSHF